MSTRINYEIILAEYAAGSLDLAQRMIVDAHLTYSQQAREFVASCEALGGALIEATCTPVSMREESLNNVLNLIDSQLQPKKCVQEKQRRTYPEDLEIPEFIQQYIDMQRARALRWRRLNQGLESIQLPLDCRRSAARIMRMNPGVCSPARKHRGLELTLILEGAYTDEYGIYQKGELIVADPQDEPHHPIACKKQGCMTLNVVSGNQGINRLTATLFDLLSRL